MFPGMRGMSPKRMAQMMKQLGISVENIEGVGEVSIKTSSKLYLFRNPEVSVMDVQGQKIYQIIGVPEIKEKGIPEEDIKLVATQANVSEEEAKKALEKFNGQIAEAIIFLKEKG
ncbi:MAG: nascent polypeptide-associated complex protein [Candidatus Thermoplasmatota archaeon]